MTRPISDDSPNRYLLTLHARHATDAIVLFVATLEQLIYAIDTVAALFGNVSRGECCIKTFMKNLLSP